MRLAARRNALAILGDFRNIGAQLRGGIRAESGLQVLNPRRPDRDVRRHVPAYVSPRRSGTSADSCRRQIAALSTARDFGALGARLGPVRDHEFRRAFQGHSDDVAFRDPEIVDQLVD